MDNMEQLNEVMSCFMFGKCTRYEYEYTFVYNDQKMKADNCYTIWGNTTCKLEDDIYKNVSYTEKFLTKQNYEGFPYGMCILPFILVFAFKELLMCAVRR